MKVTEEHSHGAVRFEQSYKNQKESLKSGQNQFDQPIPIPPPKGT